jgi:O-antigen ligase
MSTLTRDWTKPALATLGMMYLMALAVALVWMHLSAEVVLGLTIGGIGLFALILNPVIGVHAFIMLMFVERLGEIQQGLTIMKVAGPLILLGWFMNTTVSRKSPFRWSPFVIVLFAFVAWVGQSIFYASDERIALSRLFTFAQLAVATLMFAAVVDSTERLRGILKAIVLWTTVTTVISIVLYYANIVPVVEGFGQDRNGHAMFINIAIACLIALTPQMRNKAARQALLLFVLPVLLLGLALTFSRGGYLTAICLFSYLSYRTARLRNPGLLVAAAAVVLLLVVLLPGVFWQRFETILPSMQDRKDSFGTRVGLWENGLKMIADNPVSGVGAGNFAVALPRYIKGEVELRGLGPHNSYVGVAAELGLVGLALFLSLHWLALRSIRATFVGKDDAVSGAFAPMVVAIEGGIIVIMFASLALGSEAVKVLWFFLGLAVASGQIAATNRRLAAIRDAQPGSQDDAA